MFIEFLKLELRAAFKSPMLYVFFFLITLLVFGAVASDSVQIGGAIGNVYKNSPNVLTTFFLILGLIGVLFATAFFNNAALRDHNNQFNEILFHLPIGKAGYFWGRFIGALILSTIPLLGVYLGAWLGSIIGPLAGWVEADRIGPFFAETLINNYFIFVLPNMFFAGSIIFFLAHKFKNTIISFVGALAIFVAYFASGTLLSDLDNQNLAAITDVFGIRTYGVFSRYWTPLERNTLSPSFEGLIMWNRLLWLGVGVVLSVLSFLSFSFREKMRYRPFRKLRGAAAKDQTKATAEAEATDNKGADKPIPRVQSAFQSKDRSLSGAEVNWLQFRSFFKANTLSITKSVVFKIVAFFGIFLLGVSLIEGYEYYGLQSYPVTYKVIGDIAGSTSLFMIIVVIFFSGELVWRDRVSHIHEVINATPHNSFVSIFAKVASLVTIAVLLQFVFIFMGVMSQLFRGFTVIELDVYLIDFFVDTLPGYIIYAALFVLIQTLVNNRY
ncbi:MAG: hypothetical protein LC670_06915, partial [Flavobacteriales bacterium]|nr:hypothetical protein [Flavobacteriales bacterium]